MTLTQLKYFLALCESGTFASAADQCFVSQPTLSLQLKKLEAFVGASLIDRSQTPVKPTPFGAAFAQQAKAVFGEVSKLEALFEAESPNLDGQLVIGCIPTIAYYLMLPILQHLKKNYPHLTVSFYELPTHEILDRLESGFLDAAIVAGPIVSRHLHEQPLYYEPFALLPHAASGLKTSTFDMAQLEKLDLLMLTEEHCLRNQTLSICKKNQKFSKNTDNDDIIECASVGMIKQLVAANIGSAILPRLCVTHEDNAIELTQPYGARVVSLVYRTNFHKTRTLEAIEQSVMAYIPPQYLSKKEFKIIEIAHD